MNQDNVVSHMQNNINSAFSARNESRQPIIRMAVLPVIGLVLLATSCATPNEAEQPANRAPALPSASLPEGSIRYDTDDERVAQLWSAAEQARLEANTDLALQHLFEALEISPRNSLLWSRAAEIQLNNEQAAMAENLALKSNSFAGNNGSLLHRNWLIIEHARSMRGDLLGVRSAHKKVQEFKYR